MYELIQWPESQKWLEGIQAGEVDGYVAEVSGNLENPAVFVKVSPVEEKE